MAFPSASTFSPEQVSAFQNYIQLPEKYNLVNNPPRDLAFLNALHTHTISTVPYENLTLHYSRNHTISIKPQDVYRKVVVDSRGRGGYCMEVSILFNHILRGLGFRVYTAGVRIKLREGGVPTGDFVGWRHIVNIVTLEDGSRYMLDVGFGGDGATKPLPLISAHGTQNIGTQEIRLIHDHIPAQTLRTEASKHWIYQYRNGSKLPWHSFYAFPECEFFETDFHVMNWYTGSSPESFQVTMPLVVKFLRRQRQGNTDSEQEIYGKRMLVFGVVKENLGGQTQVVQECKTEDERVEALRKWFGISLTEEEVAGIAGHVSEIR